MKTRMNDMLSHKRLVGTIVLLASALLSGCATLAPERNAAENLMGKDISEGIRVFGQPFLVTKITWVSKTDKLYGQTSYVFYRKGKTYEKAVVDGVSNDVAQNSDGTTSLAGGTEYYHLEKVQESCKVLLAAGQDNVIDYYEVNGNCGWHDMGFGNTGVLHRLGLN